MRGDSACSLKAYVQRVRSPSVGALWFGWKPSFLCSTELGAERNLTSSPPTGFLTGSVLTAFRRAAAPRDSTNSTRPFPLHHESPALVARPRPHSNFACSLDARAGSGCTFCLLSAPLNGPIPTRTIPNAPTSTLLYHGLGGGVKYRIPSVLYPFRVQYRILTSTKPRSCRLGVGPLGIVHRLHLYGLFPGTVCV